MVALAIQPTVTQRVREFLASQGVGLRPWSSLEQVYAELYALLGRRRNDPAFWPPLAELLEDVVASASSGRLAAPGAEVLSSWDVRALVRDLRHALPREEPTADLAAVRRFTAGLSSAVLGGFLLLGLAASGGCASEALAAKSDEQEVAAQPERRAVEQTEQVAEPPLPEPACSLADTSVLRTTIEQSRLPDQEKQVLCACFSSLGPSWNQGLTRLFERGTPEQIATALERMVELCAADSAALDGAMSAADEPALRPRPQPRRRLFETFVARPAYKGIAFLP